MLQSGNLVLNVFQGMGTPEASGVFSGGAESTVERAAAGRKECDEPLFSYPFLQIRGEAVPGANFGIVFLQI